MAVASWRAGPENAVPSLPGSNSWLSKKKQKKLRSLFLRSNIARLGRVKLQFRCCRYSLDRDRQQTMHNAKRRSRITVCWACCAPLLDGVTCAVCDLLTITAPDMPAARLVTMMLWKSHRGAGGGGGGRRSTACWCFLRKLVFVRLRLLPYSWEQRFLDQFTYFFVLFLWKLSRKPLHRFFCSFPTISGDETNSAYFVKRLFLYVSKYFGRLTFELWISVVRVCRYTQNQAVETKKPDIFDTVIELDTTGKWVFGSDLWPFRVC